MVMMLPLSLLGYRTARVETGESDRMTGNDGAMLISSESAPWL
jgi:hypothetical protein